MYYLKYLVYVFLYSEYNYLSSHNDQKLPDFKNRWVKIFRIKLTLHLFNRFTKLNNLRGILIEHVLKSKMHI